MLCYMSDGWSAFSWKKVQLQLDGQVIADWQRERVEYLSERGVLKSSRSLGVVSAAIRVSAPRPLYHGKTSWNMYAAYVEFHPPLRTFTIGPVITFGIFDGLHVSALKRKMHGRRQLYYEYRSSIAADEDGLAGLKLEELLDFILVIHCIAHAFSLAVKWGLSPCSSAEIIEATHISIKSCKNSSFGLKDQLPSFVATSAVAFQSRPDEATLAARSMIWKLVVRHVRLQTFADESGFWYEPEKKLIFVFADFLEVAGWRDQIVAFIHALYSFPDFSETRWLGVRDSTSKFYAALLAGLDNVVQLLKASHFHSKGIFLVIIRARIHRSVTLLLSQAFRHLWRMRVSNTL